MDIEKNLAKQLLRNFLALVQSENVISTIETLHALIGWLRKRHSNRSDISRTITAIMNEIGDDLEGRNANENRQKKVTSTNKDGDDDGDDDDDDEDDDEMEEQQHSSSKKVKKQKSINNQSQSFEAAVTSWSLRFIKRPDVMDVLRLYFTHVTPGVKQLTHSPLINAAIRCLKSPSHTRR